MAPDGTLFVAIVGGFRDLPKADFNEAAKAARAIGAALAADGFGLVVFDSDQKSLEPHVVAGYCSAVKGDAQGLIRVYVALSQIDNVKYDGQASRASLFDYHAIPNDDWQAGFFRAIASDDGVDALVLAGGGMATFAAGQIGLARGIPMAALSQFGGAAAKVWSDLAHRASNGQYPIWDGGKAAQLSNYLKTECEELRKQRNKDAAARRLFEKLNARGPFTRATLCVGVLWIAAVAAGCGWTESPVIARLALLASLLFGGATGALLRSMIWVGEDGEADVMTSLTAGGIAGIVVGIAYLIPILQGAPGLFDLGQEAVTSSDRIQILSTAIVAIGAGVGFDVIFRRMGEAAARLPIGGRQS